MNENKTERPNKKRKREVIQRTEGQEGGSHIKERKANKIERKKRRK